MAPTPYTTLALPSVGSQCILPQPSCNETLKDYWSTNATIMYIGMELHLSEHNIKKHDVLCSHFDMIWYVYDTLSWASILWTITRPAWILGNQHKGRTYEICKSKGAILQTLENWQNVTIFYCVIQYRYNQWDWCEGYNLYVASTSYS